MVKVTPSVCGWIATTGFIGAHCAIADERIPNTNRTVRMALTNEFLSRILRRPRGNQVRGARVCKWITGRYGITCSTRRACRLRICGIDSGRLRQHCRQPLCHFAAVIVNCEREQNESYLET